MNHFNWLHPGGYRFVVHWRAVAVAFIGGAAVMANAESARIIKVLPQFLDEKGRASLSPSLFDRDAYQAELRDDPKRRSGIRFNVQWKARGYDSLILRVETKGDRPSATKDILLDQPVNPSLFRRWTSVALTGDDYKRLGEMVAWRVTLWHGATQVAEQRSFLW